jgi:Ca2+-binding RTX toxin-like protein
MSSSRTVRPEIESLEERCVPAAVISGGDLIILQSAGNDSAIVSTMRVGFTTFIRVQETVDGYIQPDQFFSASQVGRIVYLGGAGDDYFQNFTAIRSVAYGGAGDDALYGGSNIDLLYGEDGKDELDGGGGNDQLFGGAGLDFLYGAAGNDYLNGGNDGIVDQLDGGLGADTFEAEPYYPAFSPLYRAYNRDYPLDFNAAEGDRIVGMPVLVRTLY